MLSSAPTRSRLAIAAALLTALVLGTACSEGGGDGDGSGGAMATLQDALAAHADGELGRAEELYRDTLEEDPDNKFAHYNLGAIAQSRGDLEEAAASYDEA
ncbi:MAG TPA: tetratricopeptide repeat protein, partial [Actinomycetota bacterium]|nr:tetratricopeptide repeat protein [Actinomycetota bacterium]